jgi:hypothetical protein
LIIQATTFDEWLTKLRAERGLSHGEPAGIEVRVDAVARLDVRLELGTVQLARSHPPASVLPFLPLAPLITQ